MAAKKRNASNERLVRQMRERRIIKISPRKKLGIKDTVFMQAEMAQRRKVSTLGEALFVLKKTRQQALIIFEQAFKEEGISNTHARAMAAEQVVQQFDPYTRPRKKT